MSARGSGERLFLFGLMLGDGSMSCRRGRGRRGAGTLAGGVETTAGEEGHGVVERAEVVRDKMTINDAQQ